MAPLILNLSARWKRVVKIMLWTCERTLVPIDRWQGGPRASLNVLENRKIFISGGIQSLNCSLLLGVLRAECNVN